MPQNIKTILKKQFQSSLLEELVVDYVLRCTKGIYKENYIYINVTTQGELIGSSSDKDVTFTIDDADLAPKHASIKLELDPELERPCYILKDLNSGKPTWVKIRYDIPVVVKDDMEIKIGKKIYLLRMTDQEINEAQEWLQHTEQCYLSKAFEDNSIHNLVEIRSLTEEQIKKLFETYNLDEIKFQQFVQYQMQIQTDFPEWYANKKLGIFDYETKELVLSVGWSGATISSKTYVYQKPPDKYLQKKEFDDYEENPIFELIIRYMYGRYILQSWKMDNYNIFFKVPANEIHTLVPDDILRLGNIELQVQRFNSGVAYDQGSRVTMEDGFALVQDLGVSSKVPVSCFCVLDGHNGDECVKYISQNLLDNLREIILKRQDSFDSQQYFYDYMHDVIKETFMFTDQEFYDEYQNDKAIQSGCVGVLCMIAGDMILCAYVGDCRAVLSRNGQAIDLTVDHKPDNEQEKKRILRKGGTINGNRLGKLSVSRAFGDFEYKKQRHISKKNLLSVKPDIYCLQIDYKQDEFIVLCSDGIIDGFQKNQNLVDFVRQKYQKSKIMDQDPQSVGKDLVKSAYNLAMENRKGSDNLSVIIVNLTRGIPQIVTEI